MEAKVYNSSKENVLSNLLSSYRVRQITLWGLDICSILVSILVSIQLTGVNNIDIKTIISTLMVSITLHTISFVIFKCYSSLWRYAGEEEMVSIASACILYIIPLYLIHTIIGNQYTILYYIVNVILTIAFTGGVRLFYGFRSAPSTLLCWFCFFLFWLHCAACGS